MWASCHVDYEVLFLDNGWTSWGTLWTVLLERRATASVGRGRTSRLLHGLWRLGIGSVLRLGMGHTNFGMGLKILNPVHRGIVFEKRHKSTINIRIFYCTISVYKMEIWLVIFGDKSLDAPSFLLPSPSRPLLFLPLSFQTISYHAISEWFTFVVFFQTASYSFAEVSDFLSDFLLGCLEVFHLTSDPFQIQWHSLLARFLWIDWKWFRCCEDGLP